MLRGLALSSTYRAYASQPTGWFKAGSKLTHGGPKASFLSSGTVHRTQRPSGRTRTNLRHLPCAFERYILKITYSSSWDFSIKEEDFLVNIISANEVLQRAVSNPLTCASLTSKKKGFAVITSRMASSSSPWSTIDQSTSEHISIYCCIEKLLYCTGVSRQGTHALQCPYR